MLPSEPIKSVSVSLEPFLGCATLSSHPCAIHMSPKGALALFVFAMGLKSARPGRSLNLSRGWAKEDRVDLKYVVFHIFHNHVQAVLYCTPKIL